MEYSNYNTKQFCNNCGREGHLYNNCKIPITSIGIIAFRFTIKNDIEYLMICRRDTLGFIDFIRGKYSIYNKEYIMNMLKQMTIQEKEILKVQTFDEIWNGIWGNKKISSHYKGEEIISRENFNSLKRGIIIKNNDFYDLSTLIKESEKYESWEEPEWGFPKGRRNYQENDYSCALREFTEETGYDSRVLINLHNILPFDEIFTGSNYKSYKHKYYIAHINDDNITENNKFQNSEVSKIQWKTYEDGINSIRTYNLEKKNILSRVNKLLLQYRLYR